MQGNELLNEHRKVINDYMKAREHLRSLEQVTKYIRKKLDEYSTLKQFFSVDRSISHRSETTYEVLYENPVWILPTLGSTAQQYTQNVSLVNVPTFTVQVAKEWLLKYMDGSPATENIIKKAADSAAEDLAEYETEAILRLFLSIVTTNFDGSESSAPRRAPIYQLPSDSPEASYMSNGLLNLMIVAAQRQGKKLTHLLVGPEDLSDLSEWLPIGGEGRLDFLAKGTGEMGEIKVTALKELGAGGRFNINDTNSPVGFRGNTHNKFNDYEIFHSNILNVNGELVRAGETQIIGLCSDCREHFIMPVRSDYEAHVDYSLLRKQKSGFFGWQEFGVASIGSQHILAGVIDRYVPGTDTTQLETLEPTQLEDPSKDITKESWLSALHTLFFGE